MACRIGCNSTTLRILAHVPAFSDDDGEKNDAKNR